MRTDDPNDFIEVEVEKGTMFTTAEVDRMVREHLKEVEPGLDYNRALLKHFSHPGLQEIMKRYPEPSAPVTKAASQPGDAVWAEIRKRARRLVEEGEAVTEAAAIDTVLLHDPSLYKRYREAQMGEF